MPPDLSKLYIVICNELINFLFLQQAGEKIKVLGRINEDWLYGEKNGTKGQFPAAFVQQIFQDLPVIQI